MSEAENVQREARSLRAQEMKPAGPLTSLVASAKRITSKNLTGGSAARRSGDQKASWQEDAWEMYDLVGEQRFLASTLAGRLAQAKLFVGTLNPESPSDDPTPLENSKINDVLQAFGNSQAGRTQLLRRQAVNLFVAGDGWFVGIPPKLLHPEVDADEDGTFKPYPRGGNKSKVSDDDDEFDLGSVRLDDLEWRMLSVSEVSTSASTGKVKLKVLEGGQDLEVSPDDVYLIQVWRPHPRRWWEADSPTRASLPVLKELVGLTMHVSAQVDSRLAGAGILVVPASAQRALQVAAGQTDENATDQFTEALMEAMLTPIADRSNASAVVPLVVTVPDETVDKFQYISFATHLDSEARALRDEAIRRLALGQDAPPELLLGTSCVDTETEILTQRGWQTLDTLDPSDLVLTLNPETGLSEWQSMQAINRFEVIEEPMLRMRGKGVDSLTTMNHRWLTADHGFVTSDALNTQHRIPTAAPSADLPTEAKFSDAFVELVGWWWTEGSTSTYLTGRGIYERRDQIAQSASKNPERVARIRRCLTECFGEGAWGNEHQRKTKTGHGEPVVTFNLRNFVGRTLDEVAPSKIVTLDFVRSLTGAQLELFIQTSCAGDGWHYRQGRLDIWQRSKEALAAYELALILSGRMVTWSEYDGGWCVSDWRGKSTIRPVKAEQTSEETYTGTVWCPSVPNGTWFMRRDGAVAVTGNSMNHWGAWLTQEDTVTTHIEPPLALICDALTTQYLWPVLEQMGVEDHENYVIWYDVRHMISRPTLGTDALALHERDAISDDALRRTMGFDDEDAPEKQDDSDRVAEIVLAMVQANPALISRPGLRVLIEQLTAVVRGEVPPVYDPHGSQKPVDGIDEEEEQQTPKPAAGAPTAEDQPTAAEMSPGNPPTHIGPAEVPAA